MLPSMRTTIRIDDELYRSVRQRAAASGRTVGEIIEDAVRQALHPAPESPSAPPLVPHGRGGLVPGVDLTDNAAVREAMDEDEPLDALR
jgi:plasmid stability protein